METRNELQNHAPEGRTSGAAFFQWVRGTASRTGKFSGISMRLIGDISRRKELLYQMKSRTAAVIELVKKELTVNPDARVILFHENIREVMNLFVNLRGAGLPVIAEHSELPDAIRDAGLELFRKGVAQVIVSARSLIEGFNVPAIDVGIIVASSSSVRQRIQSLGRVLRKHRTSSGEEKTSCIHVLYAHNTVDDAIYGKEEWDKITGIDCNQYVIWTPGQIPVQQPGPPRSPLSIDTDIDETLLSPGNTYPGQYEGTEFSCDTRGNIRSSEGLFVINPGDIPNKVIEIKGQAGRFKVTPRRSYVLVRIPDGEEWTTKYVTKLLDPFSFGQKSAEESPHTGDLSSWAVHAKLGELYPFSDIPVKFADLKYKSKRSGIITRKVSRGEVLARVGARASDAVMGADAERVIHSVKELLNQGRNISRFEINEMNHVLFREGGKLFFICVLNKGLEFPEQEDKGGEE
jgi:hypothetical protein